MTHVKEFVPKLYFANSCIISGGVIERSSESLTGSFAGRRSRVVPHVSGMRLDDDAVRQSLMVLQAFVDESDSGGIFVLGGAIASAESWVAFSRDWEELLPLAPLGADMKRNFKFSEMMGAGAERASNIAAFSRVLSDHAICTLSFTCFMMT